MAKRASAPPAARARLGRWLLHKPPAGSLKPFQGWGRKSRRAWRARATPCSASALRAPSATVTASVAQVFANGFVQRPRRRAGVAVEAVWKPQPPGSDPQRPAERRRKPVPTEQNPRKTRSRLLPLADGKEGVIGSSPMVGLGNALRSAGRERDLRLPRSARNHVQRAGLDGRGNARASSPLLAPDLPGRPARGPSNPVRGAPAAARAVPSGGTFSPPRALSARFHLKRYVPEAEPVASSAGDNIVIGWVQNGAF
jgi:hypothetical protein